MSENDFYTQTVLLVSRVSRFLLKIESVQFMKTRNILL